MPTRIVKHFYYYGGTPTRRVKLLPSGWLLVLMRIVRLYGVSYYFGIEPIYAQVLFQCGLPAEGRFGVHSGANAHNV